MDRPAQLSAFDAIEADWEAVLSSCYTNTIFVTPWWQKTWYRHFGDGAELRILSFDDNGVAGGIAPLMIRDGVVGFIGDTDLCDYGDFLVPRGKAEPFYDALLDSLRETEWDAVVLRSVPEGSPTLSYLPAVAGRAGYECEVSREDLAPVATLASTWDGYVESLPKKERHELRRKMRRLDRAGASRQYVCTDPETVMASMKDFFRLHRASSPEKAEFLTSAREAFFSDMAAVLSARDQFKLAFLEVDGERVACCISFDYLDSDLLYNSGYDPSYAKLSVGLINKALAIRAAIEAGKRHFDFLRGAERYKYDLGAEDRVVYTLTLRR